MLWFQSNHPAAQLPVKGILKSFGKMFTGFKFSLSRSKANICAATWKTSPEPVKLGGPMVGSGPFETRCDSMRSQGACLPGMLLGRQKSECWLLYNQCTINVSEEGEDAQ